MADASVSAGVGGWSAWKQLLIQLMGMGSTIALAAVGTIVLCIIVQKTVGFRIDEEGESMGLDQSLHGESGYHL
jgi:Amt family ammonium transporter